MIIFDYIADIKFDLNSVTKIEAIAFALTVIIIHYFLLVRGGKYLKIEKEFKQKKEDPFKRRIRGLLVTLYSVGSILFFIFLMVGGAWLNSKK
jgi:spore coat polysaccharide biosynthesis predicted glycosyltransferase SpsG